MKVSSPLIKGQFIKRYKRFFADVEVEGEIVTAHVPNTGSMKTCIEEGASCYLTHNPDPKRKLHWTLERTQMDNSLIGVNTRTPNHLVFEAWQNQMVKHWTVFDHAQLEVKINEKSRLDLVLWKSKDHTALEKLKFPLPSKNLHFIEIKNVTMAEDNKALFPDAKTSRGTKHIEELVQLMEQGHTCEMVYVINRENLTSFQIAHEIDPDYNEALNKALDKGLKVTALPVVFTKDEVKIEGEPLKFIRS